MPMAATGTLPIMANGAVVHDAAIPLLVDGAGLGAVE